MNFNQVYFPFIRIRYFVLLAINTYIDCANNSKCSVRYIFKATKQGALKVTLHRFLLLLTRLSVIQPKMRSPTRPRTSSGHTTSVICSLNLTARIKILLNEGIEPSRHGPTPLLIGLVLLLVAGCSHSNMCAIYTQPHLNKLTWCSSPSSSLLWCNA